MVNLDLSHLKNLKHLRLESPREYNDVGVTQCMCQLFSQVNVENLEEATVYLTNNPGLECFKELDQFLGEERFAGLKRLNVSLADEAAQPIEGAPETIRALFEVLDRKGVLNVVDPPTVYTL